MRGEIQRVDPMFVPSSSPSAQAGEQHPDLVRLARRIMRGRVVPALVLMILLGVPSAIWGYTRTRPLYRSVGQVHVRPILRNILDGDENNLPPMFASYVAAQASLLRNPETQSFAQTLLRTPGHDAWVSKEWVPSQAEARAMQAAATPKAMRDGLRILHRSGEEIIEVWFLHEDPLAASMGVRGLLAAYETKYIEDERAKEAFRIASLEERRDEFAAAVNLIQAQIDAASGEYLTDDLRPLMQARVEELSRLDLRLREIDDRLIEAQSLANDAQAGGAPEQVSVESMDVSLLALRDVELARLVAERDAVSANIRALSTQFGPDHLTMRTLRGQLDSANGRINARADQVREAILAGQISLQGPADKLPMNAELLTNLRAQYAELRAKTETELRKINQADQRIRGLKSDLAEALAKRDEAADALEHLRLRERASEKLGDVRTTSASLPDYPYSDKRPALALLAGGTGASLGLAIVVLWGLMHRRYRFIEEISESGYSAPLLGCLPDLTNVRPEHDEITAWSIHQIRNLLQARTGERPGNGNVYVITSPQSGDGKTSLSLALAISFAKGGKRTVIVDLDFVGRGLTKQLQLTQAEGVRDAIARGSLNGEIHQSQVDGLSVFPAGTSEAVDETSLSSARLQGVLEPLRGQFDAIVIDTGPVLGSLEANLLCALADGVLMTVSRGQDRGMVETSLERVRWLGARSVGLVFNRASQHDMERSHSHSMSMSLRSVGDVQAKRKGKPGRPAALLGALGAGDGSHIMASDQGEPRKRRRGRAK